MIQDNPVGTGYSFVEEKDLFVKTDEEAAIDLTKLLEEIFNRNESLQKSPLYVVAESYGGKFAVTLGLSAVKAIEEGKLKLKLGGISSLNYANKMKKILMGHFHCCIHESKNLALEEMLTNVLFNIGVVLGDSWISPEDFVVCFFYVELSTSKFFNSTQTFAL